MKYFIIIVAILLSACGFEHDPEFEPYIDRIENEFQIDINYDVRFSSGVPVEHEAICRVTTGIFRNPRVLVSERWFNLSESEKKILILHEIGHCSFNRKHDASTYENEIGLEFPSNVMHPEILHHYAYIKVSEDRFRQKHPDDLQDVQYFYDEMKAWRDAQLEGKHEALGKKCDHQ